MLKLPRMQAFCSIPVHAHPVCETSCLMPPGVGSNVGHLVHAGYWGAPRVRGFLGGVAGNCLITTGLHKGLAALVAYAAMCLLQIFSACI